MNTAWRTLKQFCTQGVLKNLDARIGLIISFNNNPRCIGLICEVDHIVDRYLVIIPFVSVAPVFLGYFPLLERVLLSGLESS